MLASNCSSGGMVGALWVYDDRGDGDDEDDATMTTEQQGRPRPDDGIQPHSSHPHTYEQLLVVCRDTRDRQTLANGMAPTSTLTGICL